MKKETLYRKQERLHREGDDALVEYYDRKLFKLIKELPKFINELRGKTKL